MYLICGEVSVGCSFDLQNSHRRLLSPTLPPVSRESIRSYSSQSLFPSKRPGNVNYTSIKKLERKALGTSLNYHIFPLYLSGRDAKQYDPGFLVYWVLLLRRFLSPCTYYNGWRSGGGDVVVV